MERVRKWLRGPDSSVMESSVSSFNRVVITSSSGRANFGCFVGALALAEHFAILDFGGIVD